MKSSVMKSSVMKNSIVNRALMGGVALVVALLLACTLIATSIAASARAMHPIHITVVQMDVNRKSAALELAFKVFADDFETAVNNANKATNVVLRLGSPREFANANALIFAYIQRNFNVSIAGKPVTMSFLGKEMEGEALWVYAEIPLQASSIDALKRIAVTNTLLFDLFDDQSNLLNASHAGKKRSALFRTGNHAAVLEFD
jgi:hypothetical protein